MKPFYIIFTLIITINLQVFSQQSGLDSWTIGTGVTNFSMQGDLTSNSANLGYYLYLNKMVSPAFGFELKGQVLSISGDSQDFSSEFPVFNTATNTDNLRFEGDSFGAEFNLVINISRLTSRSFKDRKFGLTSYFGLGFHTYTAKLFNDTTDELIIDYSLLNGISGGRGDDPKSIYYTTGLGLKYKLSNRVDLELRHSLNFNNEDHLDATISSRQNFETFHTTQLGIAIKLHKKGNEHIIWQNEIEEILPEEIILEEPTITLIDTDGDGVADQFDKEPNTDKDALVYANGVAIDSDKDGVPDHLDECPLVAGNGKNGCISDEIENDVITPKIVIDTDKDGFPDDKDSCPLVHSLTNNGCPEVDEPIKKIEPIVEKPVIIDTDNDGIPDDKDSCPQIYSTTNNGCPEVVEPVVEVVEPVKNEIVVPIVTKTEEPKVTKPIIIDTDNDGIPDDKDLCPQVYSTTNNGCPEVVKPITKVVEPIKKEAKPVVTKKENTDNLKDIAKAKRDKKIAETANKKRQLELEVRKSNPVYKKERSIIGEIITAAKKDKLKEVTKPVVTAANTEKEIEFKKDPNFEKIKELNKNSIKHNIPELDNAVSHADIEETPLFPGCEDQEGNNRKKTCLIAQVTIHSLKNFDTSQFSDLNLTKGINTIRVVFVIDKNGNSSVQKIIGKWDAKVKQEAKRVIASLPKIQPGLLNNNPTSVKFSVKLPFKVK